MRADYWNNKIETAYNKVLEKHKQEEEDLRLKIEAYSQEINRWQQIDNGILNTLSLIDMEKNKLIPFFLL